MKLTSLPLDTWVVVEPLLAGEVELLSKHETQKDRPKSSAMLATRTSAQPRYCAVKALGPVAGVLGCAAGLCSASSREQRTN